MKALADRIDKFLTEYGKRSANDPDEWSSPDAAELETVAKFLRVGKHVPRIPWSEWGSGGYGPYTSTKGRTEHDDILQLIKQFIQR